MTAKATITNTSNGNDVIEIGAINGHPRVLLKRGESCEIGLWNGEGPVAELMLIGSVEGGPENYVSIGNCDVEFHEVCETGEGRMEQLKKAGLPVRSMR